MWIWFIVLWQMLLGLSLIWNTISLSQCLLHSPSWRPPSSFSFYASPPPPLLSYLHIALEETVNSAKICKPHGFPHPLPQLEKASLLTSVATGYYFTERTNFRWGAVIKWSRMETCFCLLVPQVFTSPKLWPNTLQQLQWSVHKVCMCGYYIAWKIVSADSKLLHFLSILEKDTEPWQEIS